MSVIMFVLSEIQHYAGQMIRSIVHHSPFRHRHILTRHNHLRWRFKLPVVVVACAFLLAGLGSATNAVASYMRTISLPRMVIAAHDIDPASELTPEQQLQAAQKRLQRYGAAANDIEPAAGDAAVRNGARDEGHIVQASLRKPALPQPQNKDITIGSGDTMAGVLQKNGVSGGEAYAMIEAMKELYDPRDMRPGQKISVRLDPVGLDKYALAETNIVIDPVKSVHIEKNDEGGFKVSFVEKVLETRLDAGRATIETSLYGSAAKAGVPVGIIADTIGVYSWDVDFQRDIRQGDTVEVLYEIMQTKDGEFVKNGNIIYARLNVNGQDIPVYRYEMKNGDVDYFTTDGKSVRKALMKTPINGARLSSGFGPRKHPVLGYNKMHKGLDFAAPRGTPIYAAGDGTIEKMGKWGAYGNYARIRHNSEIKTAYAHMKGFAKGLGVGKRVKQGQIIGYVGTTGRSTGPHLHYEVLRKGAQVNPRNIKLPQGETLKGQELANFKAHMKKIDGEFTNTVNGKTIAMSGDDSDRYN